MRILAIRGADLASLEGEFAVELGEAPLARAGLFAITGPTGAGKSTILDALCLALFDRIFEYLDMEPEIVDRPDAITLRPGALEGRVRFRHVLFAFP